MNALINHLLGSIRDLLPIATSFFQVVVLQQPLPNIDEILSGILMVVIGLSLFIHGLEMGLFPVGKNMTHAFARKGSVAWLLLFSFCLGFGTTIAEPALIAVSAKAAIVAAEGGMIADTEQAKNTYATGLRMTVALNVGFAI